jgi:hypothetical protein
VHCRAFRTHSHPSPLPRQSRGSCCCTQSIRNDVM